jgi:predicted nucleotidyltransferase
MELYSDFEEFIELLNKHKVKYLVVGGYVVSYYSQPRNTGDIDIFIESSEDNAKNILSVLDEFGFGYMQISLYDLIQNNQVIQLGNSPVRIDIITSIDGIEFKEAFEHKSIVKFGNIEEVPIISLGDLLKNKKLSGRQKDIQDIKSLEKNGNNSL